MRKMNIKIENMTSPNGRKVPNQFIIYAPDATYFQSYKSIIVKETNTGDVYLDRTYWDYSRTTSKYRNLFLGESTEETEEKIKNGTYKLVDLN